MMMKIQQGYLHLKQEPKCYRRHIVVAFRLDSSSLFDIDLESRSLSQVLDC